MNSNAVFKKEVALLLYPDVMSIPFGPEAVPLILELIPDHPDLYKTLVRFALDGVALEFESLGDVLGD